jgi:hypothetical protein
MDFHFPDGAEYRVTSIAGVTGAGTVRTEKNLTVAGAEPPSSAMVPALTVFLLVIALGLGAGRWTKRRTHRRDTEGAE